MAYGTCAFCLGHGIVRVRSWLAPCPQCRPDLYHPPRREKAPLGAAIEDYLERFNAEELWPEEKR